MAPFLMVQFADSHGLLYHVWVALGAGIALYIYVDVQFAGDHKPSLIDQWLSPLLALVFAFCVSRVLL